MGSPIQLTSLSTERPRELAPLKIKRQDKAAYGVGGKGFYDDKCKFWAVGQALYFDGEPNLDLHPLNKLAYDKVQAFLDKLDELGERKAKKEGKAYTRLPRMVWHEDGEQDDIPMPEFVMGVPIREVNEAIR